MRLGLESDFRDFYDHWFDLPPHDCTLKRVSSSGLSKREQFALLESAGFNVPFHGLVRDVHKRLLTDYLVVYTDEFAHCGQGKTLYSKGLALQKAPDKYCSIFIPTTEDELVHAKSERLLVIGDRCFWLSYQGSGSWMSNHANNVDVRLEGIYWMSRQEESVHLRCDMNTFSQWPLFAVDFIRPHGYGSDRLYAIDFNEAPGMKHTKIDEIVSAQKIVELIKEFKNQDVEAIA